MSDQFYQQVAIWSQVLGSVAFMVLLVYIWIRFVTPAVLKSRDAKNAELTEAERRRDAAKEEIDEARRELARATAEAQSIRNRGAGDAQALRERILADAKREGERQVRNAEGELERGRLAAREALRAELIAKALEIARESASRLSEDTNRRLVGDVVETLERGGAK
jgi:F0F1-type ATP synthase membrane subunit b/b'